MRSNMNKITLLFIAIFSCFGYVACNSSPIEGSCPAKDFNGECCIRQSDCTSYSGNPQEAIDIVAGCHTIDPKMEPLLCLDSFNTAKTAKLDKCVPLIGWVDDGRGFSNNGSSGQTVETCMGSADIWNGATSYDYNVFCCK